ncbi:hypothetical protein [Galbibacter mesophilus]|uniref:hypothetical protein n=1 Tax=Galbibacter mesophilus TaxID=379069 RepID=UPI00191EE5FD|nr:hypothetical protein [Galbibacter mesophilus]MCM5663195.1 hypothetical protein [Galbibacter mesophilus]
MLFDLNHKKVGSYDLIIIICLFFASLITFIHPHMPDIQEWDIVVYKFILKESFSFKIVVYQISLFFSHFLFYGLWYITCRYWWKHFILIPFAGSTYKLLMYIFFSIDLPFYLEIYENILLSLLCSLALFLFSKRFKYPLRYELSKSSINAESLLFYKFKNVQQYRIFLNNFMERVSTSSINELQNYIASAVLISEKKETGDNTKNSDSPITLRSKIIGGLIGLLLVSLLFIDRIYYIVPDGNEWDFGWFTITNEKFPSLVSFFWFFTYCYLTMFISLNVWFFTSKYWWKYFLLVPIVLNAYELFSVLHPNIRYIHENEIIQAAPILLILTLFLIWISLKINNYSKVERLKEKIKVETFRLVALLAETENRNKEVKEEIHRLIANKDKYEPKEYLSHLESLQEELLALKSK